MTDPLEDEWYAVRYSGELPEVALHSAFHYLGEDESGPRLTLTREQCRRLIEAAAERFREIILRDLLPANRSSPGYRGVRRAMINWRRYQQFCRRQQVDYPALRGQVAAQLLILLAAHCADGKQGRDSGINCSFAELSVFVRQLGLPLSAVPPEIAPLCRREATVADDQGGAAERC
jgi:hypothetical protein